LIPPASILAPIETLRRQHDKQYNRWPPHINLLYPFLSSPTAVSEASTDDKETNNDISDAPQQNENVTSPEPSSLKPEILQRLKSVLGSVSPFDIVLRADPPGYFLHGKRSATVWLNPVDQEPSPSTSSSQPQHPPLRRTASTSSRASGDPYQFDPSSRALLDLQRVLQAGFSECDADERSFVPHLSIGQASGKDDARGLCKEVQRVVDEFLSENQSAANGEGEVAGALVEGEGDGDGKSTKVQSPPWLSKGLAWKVDTVYVLERKGFNDRFKVVGAIKLGEE
jgi:hypothetical protein